jgi:hypothetical protein
MRERFAKCFAGLVFVLAVMLVQGCRKHAVEAQAQPAVLTVPRVQTDFPVGALRFEDGDTGTMPSVIRSVQPQQQVKLVQVQGTDDQAAAIAAAVQRRQDESLLERQEAASERQQEELDREVEQNLKMEQEVQAERRIQDAPEMPLPSSLPDQDAPRIKDNPGVPAQVVPVQPER